jgi:beta-phosphoglucomutase
MSRPDAVVFDFNGTVSHDEPLLAELFHEIFLEVGIDVRASLYFEEFAGYSDPEIVDRVLAHFGRGDEPDTAAFLIGRRTELYLERVAERPPIRPGAAEAVRQFAAVVPAAIASGAARREIDAALAAGGLTGVIEVIVSAEDVTEGKPDPEGYLIALDRLGVDGGQALAFEDSEPGVQAAVAAGMRCIAIAGTASEERLRAAGAEDVVAELDWSIPRVRASLT